MKLSLKKSTYTAILIAMALIIYVIESALPPLIPGIAGARLGLANIFVVYALYALGWQSALWVVLIKSILGPLLSGMPTGVFFSMSGSILSLLMMILIVKYTNNKVGIISVSVLGSLMHNVGQFAIAVLFTGTISIVSYFPILSAISVPCGIIVGLVCAWILKLTQNITLKKSNIYYKKNGGKTNEST
ncbi:MAG: Gx transporter family protein [Clostridiales bacterium]|nr:Gx transporter family protein [Clostridiales bacterium]